MASNNNQLPSDAPSGYGRLTNMMNRIKEQMLAAFEMEEQARAQIKTQQLAHPDVTFPVASASILSQRACSAIVVLTDVIVETATERLRLYDDKAVRKPRTREMVNTLHMLTTQACQESESIRSMMADLPQWIFEMFVAELKIQISEYLGKDRTALDAQRLAYDVEMRTRVNLMPPLVPDRRTSVDAEQKPEVADVVCSDVECSGHLSHIPGQVTITASIEVEHGEELASGVKTFRFNPDAAVFVPRSSVPVPVDGKQPGSFRFNPDAPVFVPRSPVPLPPVVAVPPVMPLPPVIPQMAPVLPPMPDMRVPWIPNMALGHWVGPCEDPPTHSVTIFLDGYGRPFRIEGR